MSGLAIPEPRAVHPKDAAALERRFASLILEVEDVEEADELRRRAEALEAYLRGTEGHPYAQGIARRTEARIGELLGPAVVGRHSVMAEGVDRHLRQDCRILADKVRRGLRYDEDGEDSPWHSSRRALLWYDPISLGGIKDSVHVEWYTPAPYIEAARKV